MSTLAFTFAPPRSPSFWLGIESGGCGAVQKRVDIVELQANHASERSGPKEAAKRSQNDADKQQCVRSVLLQGRLGDTAKCCENLSRGGRIR